MASPVTFLNLKSNHKPYAYEKSHHTSIAFVLMSAQLFAQTPVYLTKAYKPVESDRYTAYSALEIQGGDTWNNCFTLGVINNYHGYATFNIGGKYESISFILGAEKCKCFGWLEDSIYS